MKASIPLDDKPIRGLRQALTGAQAGSRIVVVMSAEDGYGLQGGDPANDLQEDDSLVLVTDIVAVREVLTRAEGTPVTPAAGLPSVQLGDDGRPTITVPQGEAPTTLVVQPLDRGDRPGHPGRPDDHRPLRRRDLEAPARSSTPRGRAPRSSRPSRSPPPRTRPASSPGG